MTTGATTTFRSGNEYTDVVDRFFFPFRVVSIVNEPKVKKYTRK